MKRLFSLTALAVVFGCGCAQAQYSDGSIKIGVMNDMSGTYSDLSGQGSVIAARMAVEDFGAAAKGTKVEIVGADHQNKPDVGSNVVRTWIDVDKVDVIVDVPTSSVALAVNEIVRDKNKVFLVSGAAASDLTGPKCTPNTIHWTYDTWALANATPQPWLRRMAERCSEKCATPSPVPTSLRSCCRRRPRRPRLSGSPMPGPTRSIRSSRHRSSVSPRAARISRPCWRSLLTCTRWDCRPPRA